MALVLSHAGFPPVPTADLGGIYNPISILDMRTLKPKQIHLDHKGAKSGSKLILGLQIQFHHHHPQVGALKIHMIFRFLPVPSLVQIKLWFPDLRFPAPAPLYQNQAP